MGARTGPQEATGWLAAYGSEVGGMVGWNARPLDRPVHRGSMVTTVVVAVAGVACRGPTPATRAPATYASTAVLGEPGFAEAASPADSIVFDYAEVPIAADVGIQLRRAARTRLGLDTEDEPLSVRAAQVRGDLVYVLDGLGRRLLGYSRNGEPVFAAGRWGKGPGEFSDPVGLALDHDTLFVLDVTHPEPLRLFDLAGQFRRSIPLALDELGSSLAVSADRIAVGTLYGREKGGLQYAMVVADRQGSVLWRGCQSHPGYRESRGRGGTLRTYAFRFVAIRQDRVFCAQPISPVVQVFDTAGRFLGVVRRAPRFYRPPRDTTLNMSTVAQRQFGAHWTLHFRFFPLRAGFVSLYATFDTTANRTRFRLFGCDSTTGRAVCGTGDSPGELVGVLPSDTLLLAVAPTDGYPHWRLDWYTLTLGRR